MLFNHVSKDLIFSNMTVSNAKTKVRKMNPFFAKKEGSDYRQTCDF